MEMMHGARALADAKLIGDFNRRRDIGLGGDDSLAERCAFGKLGGNRR
jgi:hypothetical protein